MTKIERHVGVTIINSIQFLTIHELLEIVLDDWSLMDGSCLGSCNVSSNTITESENIIESLVLKSVWVNVDNSFIIGYS